jgi:hypothetical protein
MRVVKWAAILLLGVPVVLLLTFVLIVIVGEIVGAAWDAATRYDRENADYKYITSKIVKDESALGWAAASVDLRAINNGDWQFVCVIGAYNDPEKILRREATARGVAVKEIDPVPYQRKFGALAPVEENEGAISFVDREGRGRTILIEGFMRLVGEHGNKCFGKDASVITLPLPSR